MLFFADIRSFEAELHSEIEKIVIMKELPGRWTYPDIQPHLINEVKRRDACTGKRGDRLRFFFFSGRGKK